MPSCKCSVFFFDMTCLMTDQVCFRLDYRVETVRIHKVDQVTSGLVVFIDDIDFETAHYIG